MSRIEHTLLEPPSPAYTHVTVRRAFIVWLHCGQTNKFKEVCNYFHYLEGLEDKLSAENRAVSRHHEFDLFTNPPPTSNYLTSYYPKLYNHEQLETYYVTKLEAIRNEKCVFKLEGFDKIGPQSGATKQEIVESSQLIRKYCYSHSMPLKKFLIEFKEYAAKCGLTNSVQNLTFYVKRKMVKEEITMIANCPRTFSFLEEDCVPVEESTNFLNSQRRLLDNISLTPTVKVEGTNPWTNQHMKYKILGTRNVFAKKVSQKQILYKHSTPKPEQTRLDHINLLRQKFKKELSVL